MTGPSKLDGITNIFVLMLENHSFDNIFAFSGIPDIAAATTGDCNSHDGTSYCVMGGAPPFMTTDPGHEFDDVLEQLCGKAKADAYAGGAYPGIDMSGFAARYATTHTEATGLPAAAHVGDIMACFDTPGQLPVIHALATEFAICDHWFSSLPGPTWPNRFFVHGASSAGWTDSPGLGNEVEWMAAPGLGFHYENGSIFQRLSENKKGWRLYQDKKNQFSDNPSGPEYGGWISQVASLHGITLLDISGFEHFAGDLQRKDKDGNPAYLQYPYTFIEPNFGKSFFAPQPGQDDAPKDRKSWYDGPTYKGGSSQHPEDDPSGGEGLVKATYEAIRASPVWDTSLLIVVYDEHGGFYDHVCPGPAVAPGDKAPWFQKAHNKRGFDFATLGVRVPAVVVSPLIPKGTVDATQYDHASVCATVERSFGLPHLTKRDEAANDVGHLLSLDVPRGDCPKTLPAPATVDPSHAEKAAAEAGRDADGELPDSGNVIGFLQILLKAELEHAGQSAADTDRILADFAAIRTKGQAMAYVMKVQAMIEAGKVGAPQKSGDPGRT